MSLTELTRNSFQGGISASKWLGLCKLLIARTPDQRKDDTANNLSNSVLVLFRSYPGDPTLQEYLKLAIQDGLIPVSTFVSTLLQAARSSELHIPATLDTLVRTALDAHYTSGKSPIGSVVSENESTPTILQTIQDALALLRTAHALPMSHFHQLTTSAAELVILLLACITDLNKVPTAQALILFDETNETISMCRLNEAVVGVLDTFLVSLSLFIGDDVKAAREAQIVHNSQLSRGKGDIWGPSSETDMISLGLLLNHMVTYKAHDWGAGDTQNAVVLLIAGIRWSSWTPTTYYTQLLMSALSCLSQNVSSARLWRAFIIGRLPALIVSFSDAVNADNSTNADLRTGFHEAVVAVFRCHDVIVQVDQALTREAVSETLEEDNSRPFSREFLQQLLKHHLITQELATQIDPMVANDSPPKWHAEAHDMGIDFSAYLESKVIQDHDFDEVKVWVDRVWKDAGSHSIFSNIVLKRFVSLVAAMDVDSFGHICKILHTYDHALEIVALHVRIYDLIFYSLQFLDEYDCETVGDPQTAVSHLGDVVLFVQYALVKFKFENHEFTKNNRTVSSVSFMDVDIFLKVHGRTQEDMTTWNTWFKALFDSNSEGIEDNILRSTKPKVLLRIALPLVSQAISGVTMHKFDRDVLMNGVSYFTGPLLNWTLVGVIKYLFREMHLRQFVAPLHYDIIQSLVLSTSCPRAVLVLCSPQIMTLVSERKRQTAPPHSFDISAVRKVIASAIGLKGGADSLATQIPGGQIWHQQVEQAVQAAFSAARSQKTPPHLDVRRCLKMLPAIKFLQVLWAEIQVAANMGELEACRRIATFALATPQDSTIHPVLPIFMHIVLPSLIAAIERQQPPEQTMSIELLVSIISSVLNAALQLEWAMRSMSAEDRLVLGQSSTGMARRLAVDLRRNRTSTVSKMMLQRLGSSQPFVANFPVFKSELGA